MTEDDRKDIEIYLKILEYAHKRHDWRANLEWKITLAIWTIMFASSGFFISQKAILPIWASLIAPLPFVAFHIFWLNGIYKGHDHWKFRMDYWSDKAQLLALTGNQVEFALVRMSHPLNKKSSSFYGQGKPVYLAVTIILALSFAFGPRLVNYPEAGKENQATNLTSPQTLPETPAGLTAEGDQIPTQSK